jgi:hypothetical protein
MPRDKEPWKKQEIVALFMIAFLFGAIFTSLAQGYFRMYTTHKKHTRSSIPELHTETCRPEYSYSEKPEPDIPRYVFMISGSSTGTTKDKRDVSVGFSLDTTYALADLPRDSHQREIRRVEMKAGCTAAAEAAINEVDFEWHDGPMNGKMAMEIAARCQLRMQSYCDSKGARVTRFHMWTVKR